MRIVDHHGKVECPFLQRSVFNVMKSFATFLMATFVLFFVFSCSSKSEIDAKIAEVEKKYQDSLTIMRNELKEAKSKIQVLSYPADQRFSHITELFNAQEYEKAKNEIAELKDMFPNATENTECTKILEKIAAIEAAKKAEEERIKALGFKAITQRTTFEIDYNKLVISGISVGNTFSFDDYGDSYYYKTADRGTKYVSLSMSVTSTNKDPNLPQLALYSIYGGSMNYRGSFMTKFARWSDYGSYLGNYHDNRNDFSKVSTVRFKLGLQVDDNILDAPYAIVVKKENSLILSYDRYENPPYSYSGSVSYPSTLTVEDFNKNYTLVKTYNLK